MSLLEVQEVTVRYGGAVLALADVSLAVGAGEAVALLGANGAGKTTLLRAVGGLLAYHGGAVVAGDIRFDGRSTRRADAARLVAARHRADARGPARVRRADRRPEPAPRRASPRARPRSRAARSARRSSSCSRSCASASTSAPACSAAGSSRCSRSAAR